MSGQPVSFADHPPHGHPSNTAPSTQASDKPSTASHPPASKPDPTVGAPHPQLHAPDGKTGGAIEDADQRRQPPAAAAAAPELA
ncbi:adenine phosphoribosyltransferase, partial [Teratosphaeriaceae sp. CCFEE 6253]